MESDHQTGEPSEMSKSLYVEQIKEDEYGNVGKFISVASFSYVLCIF